jgi:hypothetical protein
MRVYVCMYVYLCMYVCVCCSSLRVFDQKWSNGHLEPIHTTTTCVFDALFCRLRVIPLLADIFLQRQKPDYFEYLYIQKKNKPDCFECINYIKKVGTVSSKIKHRSECIATYLHILV